MFGTDLLNSNHNRMQPDNLRFFVLAGHLIYAVSIRQIGDRPVLQRVRHGSSRDEPVFVNGIVMPGYYIGLTGAGLFKYPGSYESDGRLEGDKPPAPGCGLDSWLLGTNTFFIRDTAGFFLEYPVAYQALETSRTEPFAELFRARTREVLAHIGYEHPTVRLSTQGRYALPQEVLP